MLTASLLDLTVNVQSDMLFQTKRPVLAVALIIYNLLVVSTGVSARCEACPNCGTESCIDNWTCSGDTITCNYPSVAYPGTWTACSYSESAGWGLTAGPSDICYSVAGDNAKCQSPNNPYLWDYGCTASYGWPQFSGHAHHTQGTTRSWRTWAASTHLGTVCECVDSALEVTVFLPPIVCRTMANPANDDNVPPPPHDFRSGGLMDPILTKCYTAWGQIEAALRPAAGLT
ncbi:hypothetical protein DFH29DRAFT_1065974 [Suillus ampliporus]|nr:hypothetical protein DFH29DRAFT_1065974 [Suillus ampliporus]